MDRSSFILSALSVLLFSTAALRADEPSPLQKIMDEILLKGEAPRNLQELVKQGPRLSGSEGASQAVAWAKKKMESYKFDKVWLQPVLVPHWERGNIETAKLTSDAKTVSFHIAALGTSIGTPDSGLEGEVIEVQGLGQIDALNNQVKGKIVFFNGPMDPRNPNTFEAYGAAYVQRNNGPAKAAKYGALAVLVRSMTTLTETNPHVGRTFFPDGTQKIPAATIATQDANTLSDHLKNDKHALLKINLSAQNLAPVTSYNVIGEIEGERFPGEIVLVGGHLDSWDLSPGAHDDGAGVVQSLEVLRSLKSLGIRPQRTIRVVLFMSEEIGCFGAAEYARQALLQGGKHIYAIESDRGGFSPIGFSVNATPDQVARVQSLGHSLLPLHADQILKGGSGADVSPLSAQGTVTMELVPESQHYFDFHHSALDVIDNVNFDELKRGAAAMAILAYQLAEMGR